ncbi:helix-turn-helix domain-containing protein [Nocardioides halotolerans]|uniref:helix-turn-helix domain-containing protein n=1 Tax=Nocardioides halotolerans TaxID=433660 RepID=UPI0004007C09|nr:helix-turn-helix domain-containing protein [Nocardioides halotolerans]
MTDLLSPETADHDDLVDTAERSAVSERPAHPGWASIPDEPEDDEVIVRRNGRVSVLLAGVSSLLSAAYFARAVTQFDDVLDWALCVGLAAITWAYVFSFLDSRMPLLVADSHGVRIRLGRTWRGIPWNDLEEVEYVARRQVVRDGRLVLFPRELEGELAMLGPAGRRHAQVTERLLGAPFALPLGLTTRVLGARGDLAGALARLADGRCEIVEVLPGADEEPAGLDDYYDADPDAGEEAELPEVVVPPAAAAVVASPTPSPLRDPRPAVRAEVAREWDHEATQSVEIPVIPSATTTFVIDDLAAIDAVDPVIGPELAAARGRLRLTVDQLAERTRIRPHVIEAIEIDDFAPCGGDFYARGHLRTLARVLGVDVAPLLETYDAQYADAPIDPRRVFEAELATGRGGAIRGTRGGPNWSVIVAAVMTVVLAWSVARLVMDHPSSVSPTSPSLADGSAGLTSGGQAASPVPVVITAAGGGAHVVVRDGTGKVVFTGSLAFGQSRTLKVSPPVRIQSTDGSLEVSVDGRDHGAMGKTGEAAQDVYTGR